MVWSTSSGLCIPGEHALDPESTQPTKALKFIAKSPAEGVFIMCDLAPYVAGDAVVERLLRDVAQNSDATVIMLGPHDDIPPSLQGVSATYDLPLPDQKMLDKHIRTMIYTHMKENEIRCEMKPADVAALATQMRGLTLDQVERVVANIIYDDGVISPDDIERAIKEKTNILASTGAVSLESPTHGLEWVAGFHNIKSWVASRSKAFAPEAVEYGLKAPRGLLLTGVPGCGKSFVTKAIASTWKMPLLRLDAGSLYDSLIGSSERNLREALAVADAVAPSVLWIDEIEKGFGTTGPSESDGGLGYRMLGTLATWMQERPAPVFLLATSNDITKLPPELTRQGRFDEIFFVDLPEVADREHMYRIQLALSKRDHTKFDCAALARLTEGFSGAEIEQSVTNALYAAFAEGRDLNTQDIAREVEATRPLSQVSPEMIDKIRQWGLTHARPA